MVIKLFTLSIFVDTYRSINTQFIMTIRINRKFVTLYLSNVCDGSLCYLNFFQKGEMKLKSESVDKRLKALAKVNREKKNFLHQTWKAFTKNTSIHAVHYLTEESIKLLEKILWFFIIFVAFMTMIYCCILLSNRFQSSLTSTVFESTYFKVSEIPFAAVTLCNNNRLDYNKTHDAIEKFFHGRPDEEVQAFTKFLHILQNMDYGSFDEFQELKNYSWTVTLF
jgi:Amiloride-sensitive sodium channel